MFIDLETGTIVNGPVVYINDAWPYAEGLSDASDADIIEFATHWGLPLVIDPDETDK